LIQAVARQNVQIRPFKQLQTSSPIKPINVKMQNIQDRISSQEEYYRSPEVLKRLENLYSLYPSRKSTLNRILISAPQILKVDPNHVKRISSLFLRHGDREIMTEEETLHLFERCSDVLHTELIDLDLQLTKLFTGTALYYLPWNIVLLENPEILFSNPDWIPRYLDKLSAFFTKRQINNLILHNPSIFTEKFSAIEEKINFLLREMNVSLHRISRTQHSLAHPLDFYTTRYEFLNRAGKYKHPDPNQQGLNLVEAQPNLNTFVNTSELDFVAAAAPELSIEEFNVFKSVLFKDQEEVVEILAESGLTQEEYLAFEDEKKQGSYKGGKRKKQKNKK